MTHLIIRTCLECPFLDKYQVYDNFGYCRANPRAPLWTSPTEFDKFKLKYENLSGGDKKFPGICPMNDNNRIIMSQ